MLKGLVQSLGVEILGKIACECSPHHSLEVLLLMKS